MVTMKSNPFIPDETFGYSLMQEVLDTPPARIDRDQAFSLAESLINYSDRDWTCESLASDILAWQTDYDASHSYSKEI